MTVKILTVLLKTINTLGVVAVRYFRILLPLLILPAVSIQAEMPIFAAYVSDKLTNECVQTGCQVNVLDANQLSALASTLKNADEVQAALLVSEYQVLIGNALIEHPQNSAFQTELVLEITTNWRNIPIDDITLRATVENADIERSAATMLANWSLHIEQNLVLEADRIYQTLGASDYLKELHVPNFIGDFVQMQTAIYRDPLLGSITRYSHPNFAEAVVDISVYPFSPFTRYDEKLISLASSSSLQVNKLKQVMENEIIQIQALIAQAQIQDFSISTIEPAVIEVNGEVLEGMRMEVLLNTTSDPIYSTQYVFQQNDKVIKLTGNLPEFMMRKLVTESIPQIKVPQESRFMKSLRQG